MKKSMGLLLMLSVSGWSVAQEVGRVVSSTPILEQVGVPRQVCTTEQVVVQQPKSGAGAVMGAIAGGAMGNAVGQGGGRAVATMLGLMGGAIIGDRIEGGAPAQVQDVQRCATQVVYENRPVAYRVVYEYAGKRYEVQMPNDPGPTIRLNIAPVVSDTSMPRPIQQVTTTRPVYVVPPSAGVVWVPSVSVRYSPGWERMRVPVRSVAIVDRDSDAGRRDHRDRHWH